MGHKRNKIRGSFENQAPGLTGPGITEPAYPDHMPNITTGRTVVISLDHPENNPPGVTVEEFTEEVPRDSFGINVGQQMEDLLKAHISQQQSNHTTPNKKEETKMEDNINPNKQEESKMNEETKVNTEAQNNATNQEQPKADPKAEPNTKKEEQKVDPKDAKRDAPKEDPKEDRPDPNQQAPRERYTTSLAREAGSAFTIGASYGVGVIVGMAAGAAIVYGVKKIFCGDGEAAAETASDTVSNLF